METATKKNHLLVIILIVVFSFTALLSFGTPTKAQAREIAPCSLIDTVLDCYSSFSTANNPEKNIAQYDETYRNLTYRNGYSLKGTTCLWTSAGIGPNNFPGFISRMQCNYKTW
ncbi:hypothetical protein [uncultured Parolsenella sp.]|uniref:hypothetical protein n=1 Tax=uncultured Parolsenella sp. TaxID=2083008 RepID=UPI0025F43E08|nr:hypothetical protein [uncultured Parolsenella sp.]